VQGLKFNSMVSCFLLAESVMRWSSVPVLQWKTAETLQVVSYLIIACRVRRFRQWCIWNNTSL